ncbi:carboxypeptidase-like regulatory domain-containing protein [Segetibacter sp. 3557_3]|uniref:carboxypeptidase-like regulatory domain-containing protein n=1 Tax=Segetibacter sp. 3557_3 TaxID=2547429 RepID=UPI001404588D|nr:carboxypeptidase-like regulatory domain-containing protein [Segetibacter sp. 3557_3]
MNKVVAVNISGMPVEQALRLISNKGNFYFSYNSSIINPIKKVSAPAGNTTVKQLLDAILENRYTYIESNNYLILRLLPAKITIVTNAAVAEEKHYAVNGYVLDANTNLRLQDATIYEKKQLASVLTNSDGYFKIRMKNRYKHAALTISKFMYEDTTVAVSPKLNQQLTILLTPENGRGEIVVIKPTDYYDIPLVKPEIIPEPLTLHADTTGVESTRRAGFLLTAGQKIRSLNLRNFFTSRPFQVSFTPGLSTQGKLSSQVSNNFSLNILGGYTGGVRGLELAGLFNINKQEVKYTQVAGLFNINGGNMTGVQVGGINNTLLAAATGVQVAGISNIVRERFAGVQVAGLYNHVSDTVSGIQVAGVSNFTKEKVGGVQIAGIGNLANREMDGVQIAGIFNYAKRLRGVQIGLINIADTSDGYSIGLLNIVFKGYHKLAISSNETTNINAAFKTGNKKLYSILTAGYNRSEFEKAFALGYGIGREFTLSKYFSINPELSSQYLYLGSVFDFNLLHKFQLDFHLRPLRRLALFGGPSFNIHQSDQSVAIPGYKFKLPGESRRSYPVFGGAEGWIGWNVGVAFF